MKRIIATILSAMVGLFGYTIVDTAIEARVSSLESRVAYLESVVEKQDVATTIPVLTTKRETTTAKRPVTTTKKPAPTTVPVTERYVVDSGSCGLSTNWTLYSDGEIIITGEGAMDACTTEFDVPIAWDNYRSMIRKATISNGITYIGFGAFANCNKLESVSIPDTVTQIGDFAFSRCSKLKAIIIPENTTSIGHYAISYCLALETLVIPEKVTEIGLSAFDGCANLKSVTIGTKITDIPDGAFNACGIKDIYYRGTEEQWNAITVGEDNYSVEHATVHYNYGV